MANSNATRKQLQWPPQLNMADDRPVVDTTYTYWEKQNSVYLNGVLNPVYVKNTGNYSVYDHSGNEYTINNGQLCRNGTSLFNVTNAKFVRTDVTDEYNSYLAFDIDRDGVAYIEQNNDNSITLKYGSSTVSTSSLYEEGKIITSRVRVVEDNTAIAVIYYTANSKYYVTYIHSTNRISTFEAKWVLPRTKKSANSAVVLDDKTSIIGGNDPIINIAYINADSGIYGVSLVSNYGETLNSRKNGIITFVEYNDAIYNYCDTRMVPANNTSQETVTSTTNQYFNSGITTTKEQASGACLQDPQDSSIFYDYSVEGTVGPQITFPLEYTPIDSGTTVTIDGETYNKFTWAGTRVSNKVTISAPGCSDNWAITIAFNDGHNESLGPNTDTNKTITHNELYYAGQQVQQGVSSISISWTHNSTTATENIPTSYWNRSAYLMSITETSVATVSWSVCPNVFTDSGNMFSMWGFNISSGNSWSSESIIDAGLRLVLSGAISSVSVAGNTLTYNFSTRESVNITSDYNVVRSNSFNCNQNFWQETALLNNTAAQVPSAEASGATTAGKFLNYNNSSSSPLRYNVGYVTSSDFNYYTNASGASKADTNSNLVICPSGYRAPVKNDCKWNILYNTTISGYCLPQGISYSGFEAEMGTLVAPWSSIDDTVYIAAYGARVIYRDASLRWYEIRIMAGTELSTIFDDRYILVNTTSFWNMYDSVTGLKMHYATDYNDRCLFGSDTASALDNITNYARLTASAINAGYKIMPRLTIVSRIIPSVARIRCDISNPILYSSVCPEDEDVQSIDVYYSERNELTIAKYRLSINPYAIQTYYSKFNLVGSTYGVTSTSSAFDSVCMFTTYINNVGNRDVVKETFGYYTLIYINNNTIPVFLYSATSEVNTSNNEALPSDAFFCLQGQFYGVINNKIYSIIYSNNTISDQDAIVDINGMQFIGNNPMIAFFWNKSQRSIYSFTGDANLAKIYDAAKFTDIFIYNHKNFYDESTQTIFIPTNKGLLCFGPKNQYLISQFSNTSNIQVSNDGVTHIIDNGNTYNLVYFPTEGYEAIPIDMESSFYGFGNNEISSIDRWTITLFDYNDTKPSSYLKVGVRSLTDKATTSEDKTYDITPSMWDKYSRSIIINYNPKLIQGQGLRLFLETPMCISSITAHIMDRNISQLTKHNI